MINFNLKIIKNIFIYKINLKFIEKDIFSKLSTKIFTIFIILL